MSRGCGACLLVIALQVPLVAAFPTPRGYVNDFAGVLDDGVRAELDRLLRETEGATSAEIAVVTVSSLDGMTVEEYANRLFQQWGIGRKHQDNGVLLLVAPADRSMRIEVGYGLEPILPDGLAGNIIRTECLPEFRRGRFASGILNGARRIATIVRQNQPAPVASRERAPDDDRPPALLMIPFFGLFIAFGSFTAGLGMRTRTGGPVLFGAMFAGMPLLMAVFQFFNAFFWILPAVGLGMFVSGYRKGDSPYWRKTLRGSPADRDSSDGWTMGLTNDSGSDSGSSGSDFGGGSSGGGGASGHW